MERPSHIEMLEPQSPLQRLPILALAISLQVGLLWLFAQGLATQTVQNIIRDIEVTPFADPKTPPTLPPPKPVLKEVPRVNVVIPEINWRQEGEARSISPTLPPSNTGGSGTAAGVDRAPVSIASTHTTPPYPVVARRAGMEGNVTLRLTVLADGHVGQAEVAVSSGHGLLDEAAQAWILGHWTYKPGLKDGVPVVSHATALVTFALENSR